MEFMQHQKKGFDEGLSGGTCFFWDCGTGKTILGLSLIRAWVSKGCGPGLVICPLSIIESAWLEDNAKIDSPLDAVSLWDKRKDKRIRRLNEDHELYIVNYDQYKLLWPEITKRQFGTVIVDESVKLQDNRSQITRSILTLAGYGPARPTRRNKFARQNPTPFRYCLSGIPAPRDEQQYWGQVKFVTGYNDQVFSKNFYQFRNNWFIPIEVSPTQRMWKFNQNLREEFHEKLSEVAHVVRTEDVMDLPERHAMPRKVYLSSKEQSAYKKMERELVVLIQQHEVLAKNALDKCMRLRELTSGFLYREDGGGIVYTGKSKLTETKNVLAEIGDNQVIIWYNFKAERDILLETLGEKAQAAGSPGPQRNKVISDFKQGRFQYLIAYPGSLGHGLTLTNAHYNLYYSISSNYDFMEQSAKRTHRKTQDKECYNIYLLAANTYDEILYKTVLKRESLKEATMAYLRGKQNG